MNQQILRRTYIISLLLIANIPFVLSGNCGAVESETSVPHICCRKDENDEAICESAVFHSFPPFPPGQKGCSEWCGTGEGGNAERFLGESVKKFIITDFRISRTFNKDALRQYPNIDEIKFTKCSLPTFTNQLFYFKEGSKIREMTITESNITGIEADAFYGLESLEVLSLTRNHLTNLPEGIFDNLPNLRFLYLSGNRLTDLNLRLFKNLENLEELYLSKNPLSFIGTFPALRQLRSLHLKSASLSSVGESSFSRLPKLSTLDLKENHLRTLPGGVFSRNPSLARISLDENELEDIPAEVFGSLCHLRSLGLKNNGLTTPKAAFMAAVFHNMNDPEAVDLQGSDMTGNPWKCKSINEDLKEYTLFVNTVYRYDKEKSVRHGLKDYINIRCADTGDYLIDLEYGSSPILNDLTETQRHDFLSRHNCSILKPGLPKEPACPFMSSSCKAVPPPIDVPEQLIREQDPKHFYFIGGGLIAVILVLLILVHRARRSKNKQRHLSESSTTSHSPPFSFLDPADVTVSEPSSEFSQYPSAPNQNAMTDRLQERHLVAPLIPQPFSICGSADSCSINSVDKLCQNNIVDDVINEDAVSETAVKQLFSGRGTQDETVPNTCIVRPSDVTTGRYEKEKKRAQLSHLPGEPEYTAADFTPDQTRSAMPGYLAMQPIGGLEYVSPNVVLLPGNLHRRLPSVPSEHPPSSDHQYDSIKDTAAQPIGDSDGYLLPVCVLHGRVEPTNQRVCSVTNQRHENVGAGYPNGPLSAHHPYDREDENGYLLPDVTQIRSQCLGQNSESDGRKPSENSLASCARNHQNTGTTDTDIERHRNMPVISNTESMKNSYDHLHESGQERSSRFLQRESQVGNGRQNPDSGQPVDVQGYLFHEEISQHSNTRRSCRDGRPVSQQPLLDNIDDKF